MNQDAPLPTRRSWPRRVLNRLEVDKAVFFSVALRGWQLNAGLVTAVLMSIFFSKPVQGYYYTFASLVALQTLFELGFNIVIINICSHEWSRLKLESNRKISGDPQSLSRLVHLGRLLCAWYSVAALLFVVIVSVAGSLFLRGGASASVSWQAPWLALVLISGGLLVTVPFHAVLEGCNQVVAISVYRLFQAIASSVVVWCTMMEGGGLWATVAAAGTRLVCDVIFLGGWYGPFFREFQREPTAARVDWRTEVWPLQWRLAMQAVVGYLTFFFFTPLMFHVRGADVAAEMGMTWTGVTALQAAALAWVQTRGPRFGMLISKGDYAELDRIFFRLVAFASAAYVVGSVIFLVGLAIVTRLNGVLTGRLLPWLPTILLLGGVGAQMVASCQAIYVRAHRREPFLLVSLVGSLTTGLSAWLLGVRYGPTGVGIACLAVNSLFTLPIHTWIVHTIRRERVAGSPVAPSPVASAGANQEWEADSFVQESQRPQPGFWAEFLSFLVHSPSWWLAPIVIILVLFGLAILLVPAEALPFIYTLW